MGFWDTGIADLGAIGVAVSDAQTMALEQGGEVLAIRSLLSPWWSQGDETPMRDQDGQVVYITARFDACSVYDRLQPNWSRDHGQIREYMESEFAHRWRSWPSYVGQLDEAIDQRYWEEGLTYIRVWDGIPLMNDMDLAAAGRITAAVRKRVYESVYEELVALYDYETSGEFDIGEILSLINLCPGDEEAADEVIEDLTECDPDYVRRMINVVQTLVKGHYVSFDKNDDGQIMKDCTFLPMEHYLEGDREALNMWKRLVNRRESALAIITNALPSDKAHRFDEDERST